MTFQLRGKSDKMFDIILCTKSVFFKFRFGGGAAGLQPPPPFGATLVIIFASNLALYFLTAVPPRKIVIRI